MSRRSLRVGAAVVAALSLVWALWSLGSGLVRGYPPGTELGADLIYTGLAALGSIGAYVGVRRGAHLTPPYRWFIVAVIVVGLLAGLLGSRTHVGESRRIAAYGLPYAWLRQEMARAPFTDELAADWRILPGGFLVDLVAWSVAGYGLAVLASRPETDASRHQGWGL